MTTSYSIYLTISTPLDNSYLPKCTPLCSSSSDTILLSPWYLDMLSTPSSQLTGRPSSESGLAHSTTSSVLRDTSVVPTRSSTRGPVTRFTTTRFLAPISPARSRNRPAVGSGSTTKSSLVKRVRTDRLITTASSSTTSAAAVASAASLIHALSA